MSGTRERYIALLRGVNVSGKNKVPMAQLRALCARIGCDGVQTCIQSGNVVFVSGMAAGALEQCLEAAITQEFGLTVPVIVRTAGSWKRYVRNNPFPSEAKAKPNRVLLCLSKRAPAARAASELQQRATPGERVAKAGDAIWIHYAMGKGANMGLGGMSYACAVRQFPHAVLPGICAVADNGKPRTLVCACSTAGFRRSSGAQGTSLSRKRHDSGGCEP